MDVQPQVGVGDEEELGVVVATEVSPAAGAQLALDQVGAQRLAYRLSHELMMRPAPW